MKSPGIKPKRHNISTGSASSTLPSGTLPFSNRSVPFNSSEGEQSPPGNMQSAHENAIFVNVNLPGNSSHSYSQSYSHSFSQSQMSLNTNTTADMSDTISLNSSATTCYMMDLAPELPKRSNSIVSMSNSTSESVKPILSPRFSETFVNLKHAPNVSPKVLDALNEDVGPLSGHRNSHFSSGPESVELREHRNSVRSGTVSSLVDIPLDSTLHDHPPTFYPPSPKPQSINSNHVDLSPANDLFGPIPISPHVNVPNTHSFNHVPAPPLPPRSRRKELSKDLIHSAQIKQAPDAPQLPPRDLSPPPLPPRTSLSGNNTQWLHGGLRNIHIKDDPMLMLRENIAQHNLALPHTSTIMMRRKSGLDKANQFTSPTVPQTPPPTQNISPQIPHVSPVVSNIRQR